MPIFVCVILDIYVRIFTNKKRLIQNQSLAIQNRVENIGFDRRILVFGEAGIPLKINIFFIPATVYPQVSNATFLIASRRSR